MGVINNFRYNLDQIINFSGPGSRQPVNSLELEETPEEAASSEKKESYTSINQQLGILLEGDISTSEENEEEELYIERPKPDNETQALQIEIESHDEPNDEKQSSYSYGTF